MITQAANWLARHKNLVVFLAFLCGLMVAEAPTVVRHEQPADLMEQSPTAAYAHVELQLATLQR